MKSEESAGISFGKANAKEIVRSLLLRADIQINGSNAWDIQVHDQRFYSCVFNEGSLGLGEAYMSGMWDCQELDTMFFKLLSANMEQQVAHSFRIMLYRLMSVLFNRQALRQAQRDVRKHYDLGNDLFEAMLDERMIYSCAYWQNANTLEEAQVKKLDLICRKLRLEKGQRILDIGCGWGGFAAFAAERYEVEVTGLTLSVEQVKFAATHYRDLPVDIRLQDYRNLHGKYDHIVSVGMFEHVGYRNYRGFMEMVKNNLKENGLFLLHTIGNTTSAKMTDPWIHRYVFPNGMMPSIRQIGRAAEGQFIMEDWHNFGHFYDLTLMEWLNRFKSAWPELEHKYGKVFYRMWTYYLCCSAASFRAKKNQLWQIVFAQASDFRIYQPVR